MSRGKCSFWKLKLSLLVNVSWKTLVLEACIACHFWRKSRGKCSFWKLGLSLWVKVSCKMLVLEAWLSLLVDVSWKSLILKAWIVTFGESLVGNARFGSLHCHFW